MALPGFFGSFRFVVVRYSSWPLGLSSTQNGSWIQPFDPYPFPFLSLIVGIEFIFLTTGVLVNQKHQIRRADQWSHLHLQLSMLTEQEVTENMKMLRVICQKLEVEMGTRDQE